MLDEEGNFKGRTSADDRYTLTYGEMDVDPTTPSELDTESQSLSTPHSNSKCFLALHLISSFLFVVTVYIYLEKEVYVKLWIQNG